MISKATDHPRTTGLDSARDRTPRAPQAAFPAPGS